MARSQQPRRARQRSAESPGAAEEQRTRGRIAGMLPSVPPSLLGHHDLLTPLLSSAANQTQPRSRFDSGHELHASAGQSLVGVQRLLQNVRHTQSCPSICPKQCHLLIYLFIFLQSTVNTLGVLTGKLLLGMTKEEIRTVCPEEGGKVFFLLQAVKSSIAVRQQVTRCTQTHAECIFWH